MGEVVNDVRPSIGGQRLSSTNSVDLRKTW
jgi:hypothetical protein